MQRKSYEKLANKEKLTKEKEKAKEIREVRVDLDSDSAVHIISLGAKFLLYCNSLNISIEDAFTLLEQHAADEETP